MGKKSKDKKIHKHKHKRSHRDSSHSEHPSNEQTINEQPRLEQPRTRIRLSYRRTDDDDNPRVENNSQVQDNNEEEDIVDDQMDVNVEDNAIASTSRENPRRTILRLKFNPDSPSKKSKKRKHKHKRRTEVIEAASSHSHEKANKGKRKAQDLIEGPNFEESDRKQNDNDDDIKSTHSRKKVKHQRNIELNENVAVSENINTQSSLNKQSRQGSHNVVIVEDSLKDVNLSNGDNMVTSTNENVTMSLNKEISKEVQDYKNKKEIEKSSTQDLSNQKHISGEDTKKQLKRVSGKKPLEHIEIGPSIYSQDRKEVSGITSSYQLREKRSYPPSFKDANKSDESRPSKVHKTIQSFQEGVCVIASPKSSEIHISQQHKVAATKYPDISEDVNGKSTIKDVTTSSSIKSGSVRKLGRPPKLLQDTRNNIQRNWTWQKKKKDLKTILNKLLDSFEKKDAYGFFLEPVDTSIVTDYSTIITNPMDLGTMRRKVENNEYPSIDAFKDDLAIICNNCKTYNAPETLYYKSAEKLWAFGEKSIERERDSILLEEEKAKALEEIIDIEYGGKKANINNSSRGSSVSSRPIRQPRRTKRGDPRKQFAQDGSVLPFGNPEELLPKAQPFGETPLLTVISSKAQRPARFEDYGPFATLGMDAPYYSPSEKEYFYNIYGDERGYAYSQSIKNFVKDMGDEMNTQVDNFLNKLTRGAYSVDQQIANMEAEPIDTSAVLDTEFGPVNVGNELSQIRRLPELRKHRAELEMWQNEKIDLDFLVSDQEASSMLATLGNTSFQEMLDLNAKSLAELIAVKNNENAVARQGTQKQLVDDVQHRLFQLAQHAPRSEIKSHTISPMQSYVMPVPVVVPQATETLIPKHATSGVEQNDPISALAPSLPEFPAISGKGRTKPCNYNPAGKCANCQTIDTPGWRAGETSDQKLCNAAAHRRQKTDPAVARLIEKADQLHQERTQRRLRETAEEDEAKDEVLESVAKNEADEDEELEDIDAIVNAPPPKEIVVKVSQKSAIDEDTFATNHGNDDVYQQTNEDEAYNAEEKTQGESKSTNSELNHHEEIKDDIKEQEGDKSIKEEPKLTEVESDSKHDDW
ncbi:546_t:CDS:10 [Funneliformis geosporum]|uniref:546_t:CDS:1 n=1 Tax=Funneliformis geosporum TaxID=1117311 RepID=A0A9W4ST16_9GLOM|nr:546_t:CDS:10 [Funneliformis geosporum]